MKRALLVLPVAIFCLGGCMEANFFATDNAFQKGARHGAAEVFLDHLPPQPYRVVGLVEVNASDDTALHEVVEIARERGRKVGCDVLVEREIHRLGCGEAVRVYATAATGPVSVDSSEPAQSAAKREFICGVFDSKLNASR
jgi:hypothetical protein